tara:strand:- start:1222 stop:1689 length:468 start_codon:yes stop_codon:yes gene_type:complete
MATVTGAAGLLGTGTLPKAKASDFVSVYRLCKLDNKVLTAHNRKLSITVSYVYDDVQLLSGNKRRFLKSFKQTFQLNWQFLPSRPGMTVDGQYGRDYIQSVVGTGLLLDFFIQDTPNDAGTTYTVFVESYNEDLVRRELITGTHFYNVSLVLKET